MKALLLVVFLCSPAFSLELKRLAEVKIPSTAASSLVGNGYMHLTNEWQRIEGQATPVAVTYKILDIARQKTIDLSFPIHEFFKSRTEIFPTWAAPELVFYDGKKAGLLMKRIVYQGPRTEFFCTWDLKSADSCEVFELAPPHGDERIIGSLGPPSGNHVYFAYYLIQAKTPSIQLFRIKLGDKKIDWEMNLPLPKGDNPSTITKHAISFDGNKLALGQHAEKRNPGNPQIYIVDVPSKTFSQYPNFVTAYGMTFSRDDKFLALGSLELGEIMRIDIVGKKIDLKVKAQNDIHFLFPSPSGKSLLIFSSHRRGPKPLEIRNWMDFKLAKRIRTSTLFKGIEGVHPSGMVASRDGKYLVTPAYEKSGFAGPNSGVYVFAVTD